MIQNLTIIGLGLLGGSIGLGVRKRISDCRIMGCAHREGSLAEAKRLGAIDEWTLDVGAAVERADVVVLCMPVGQIPMWIERIGKFLKHESVVTDVGSTKAAICAAGEAMPGPGVFVGSHPMAGSEKTGVAVARADLFEGATCVVTPCGSAPVASIQRVEQLWRALGMRVVRHDPATHDHLVALVSHLPHAVAAAVVGVQSDASIDLRGKGFIDTTRIAAGDAGLWRDILMDNRANVVDAIDQLNAELSSLARHLRAGDATSVESWLAKQSARRSRL